jgi:crotonobetainyl-CoA:carnitine CoA-transferase CaiB-like acyl-CoA transferase
VSAPSGPGPLDGIDVVDLSRVLAGPLVAMTLGDLGADVVKVESPSGDDTRRWQPPVDAEGRATYHHTANRNKRSVILDLKQADDLELARRLCERADVVVSNFLPGTLERFGLDHGTIARANPAVVHCEISGFGDDSRLPGYDPLVQALSGLMSVTGPPGAPSKTGVAVTDIVAALYATIGVLGALYARRDTGRGQRVTVSLLHASLALLANQSTGYLATGEAPVALGNVHPSIEPFATYAAADGELMICAGSDAQFARLAQAIGLDDDERFATNEGRVAHRDELRARIEERLAARTCAEWAARIDIPVGRVQTIAQGFSLAAELRLPVVDETDGVRTVSFPAVLSGTPAAVRRRPPDLDEHGGEIRGFHRARSGP